MPGEFEQNAPAGDTGGFNMEAAVSDIAGSLGFGGTDDDLGDAGDRNDSADASSNPAGDTGDSPSMPEEGEPQPGGEGSGDGEKPAPTPAPAPGQVDLSQAPKTWRKEVAAAWETLPEPVRAEIHKREQDMYVGLEQYREGANFGWQVQSLFRPYASVMQQAGIGPEQILPGLVQSHATLALGTDEQKMGLMQQLIKDYSIPVPKLLSALTGGALADLEPYVDPQVKDLQQRVEDLQSRLTRQDQSAAQARQAEIRQSVAAFANDPANIYFEELADDIAALIRGGVTQDIKVAYEKALWANPVTREKESARRAAAAESERTRKAAEAAEKARKATSANVRSTARAGNPTVPKSASIDETLEKTLAAIQARSN